MHPEMTKELKALQKESARPKKMVAEQDRDVLGRERVSKRRACRVLDQTRSIQRRKRQIPSDEPRLVKRITELASEYGRYGYRRVITLLQAEGWWVNHKRVERLWRQEDLKVPQKQPT